MNWLRYYRRESQNTQKISNLIFEYIFSLVFYKKPRLGPSFWFTLFWGSNKSTELVQTLTLIHKHGMQQAFPKWINELMLANLADTAL